jgi:hypothetical protein
MLDTAPEAQMLDTAPEAQILDTAPEALIPDTSPAVPEVVKTPERRPTGRTPLFARTDRPGGGDGWAGNERIIEPRRLGPDAAAVSCFGSGGAERRKSWATQLRPSRSAPRAPDGSLLLGRC